MHPLPSLLAAGPSAPAHAASLAGQPLPLSLVWALPEGILAGWLLLGALILLVVLVVVRGMDQHTTAAERARSRHDDQIPAAAATYLRPPTEPVLAADPRESLVRLDAVRAPTRGEALRGLLDAMSDPVLLVGERGTIRTAGAAAGNLLGVPHLELAGRDLVEFFTEEHAAVLRPGGDGGRIHPPLGPVEVEGQRADGTRFPAELSVLPAGPAAGGGFAVVLRDLTDRRHLEAEMRRLSRAAEAAADSILMTDAEGRIIWVNPAFTAVNGYAREEVIGENPKFLKSGAHPEEFYTRMWSEISQGRTWSGRMVNRRKQGSIYHCALTVAPVLDEAGRPTGYIGIQRDVTAEVDRQLELLHLQEEISRTNALLEEKNRHLEAARHEAQEASLIKSRFLSNMSHELRTPLHGVMGCLDLLLENETDALRLDYLQTSRSSAAELLSMVDDILDFTLMESGEVQLNPGDLDLEGLTRGVADLMAPRAEAKGLAFSWSVDPRPVPPLKGDRCRIHQLLKHLVDNAVKFTEKGEVRLAIAVDSKLGDTWKVTAKVEDTGVGIPPAQQQRLFEPFFQADGTDSRRYGGAGIGLALCRRIVEAMHGRIRVESAPGEGTRVQVTFRLMRALGTGSSSACDGAGRETASRARVLVVDDNVINLRVAAAILGRAGHEVETAGGGEEALEALERGQFDLVLLDCQMPGMDGFAVVKEVRRREKEGGRPRTPIVAMTARMANGDRVKCLDAGMDGYLAKPVQPTELKATVHRWSGKPAAAETEAPPPAPAGRPSTVEDQVLARLDELGMLRERKDALDAVETFLADADGMLERLVQGVALDDPGGAEQVAHRLRGASLNLGADVLSSLAAEVEERCSRGETAGMEDLLRAIREELLKVRGVSVRLTEGV